MSHKRINSLFKTVNYYRSHGIDPVICDNTPDSFWNSSGFDIKDIGCKFCSDEKFSFYDQLIWLSEYFLSSNEELISICPDEDLHYHRWFNYSKEFYKSTSISLPITCIYGPSLNCRQDGSVFRISNAMPASTFTCFEQNCNDNAILAMTGQVPFLWRTYPSDFFASLMKTVKWFAFRYGDKIAEQVVWNLLVPSMGSVAQPLQYVHFIRKDSLGLRFQGLSDVGKTPFIKQFNSLDCYQFAVELEAHCADFPDRFIRPSKELFSHCLLIVRKLFATRPWAFSRNDESCFYVDDGIEESRYKMYKPSKLTITGREESDIFNIFVAASLNLPIYSLNKKDIPSITTALSD